jgi:hypothetical protein
VGQYSTGADTELHQVQGWLGFDEFDSKHDGLLNTVVLYNR